MAPVADNAAARRARISSGRMDPKYLRTRGRDALAEDFRRLDRRSVVAMPETDRDGFIEQLLVWFEIGQGTPTFRTDEVLRTGGDRLVLCRVGVSFPSGETSEFLQIYRYDEAVERLELVIAYDADGIDAAQREFAEIEAELSGE